MSAPPGWTVGVVIPACDEESSIRGCIHSVRAALTFAHVADSWIVVVADNCSDRTAQAAQAALGDCGEVIVVSLRSAGAARRAGVARVLSKLHRVDPASLWLANTDADTTVRENWLHVQLALADRGVTGVAGIVELASNACAAAHAVHQSNYHTSADGSHTHVHGANLAVRADAYEDVGGWSELALAEDHCLWARLRRGGWLVLSSVSSVVTTSARLEGRAPGGFADTLRFRVEALNGQA